MRYLTILATLTLAACDAQTVKTWVGDSESNLYAKHGTPLRESRLSDGSKALAFPIRNMYGQPICERNFIVSPQGRVTQASTTCL